MRMVVDLPAPLGPMKPVNLPGWISKERSLITTFSPYFFVSPEALITATRGASSVEPARRHDSGAAPSRP